MAKEENRHHLWVLAGILGRSGELEVVYRFLRSINHGKYSGS